MHLASPSAWLSDPSIPEDGIRSPDADRSERSSAASDTTVVVPRALASFGVSEAGVKEHPGKARAG